MKKYLIFILAFICLPTFAQITEVQECDNFYKKGKEYKVMIHDSIQVLASISRYENYGSYYKVNYIISNQSDKRIEFMPQNISAKLVIRGNSKEGQVYNYQEYANKAKRKIEFASAMNTLGSSLMYLSANTTANYSDNNGNMATINVRDNDAAATSMLIRDKISNERYYSALSDVYEQKEGYLERETLFSKNVLSGYVLIKYKECDNVTAILTLDNVSYISTWRVGDKESRLNDKSKDDIYK